MLFEFCFVLFFSHHFCVLAAVCVCVCVLFSSYSRGYRPNVEDHMEIFPLQLLNYAVCSQSGVK